MLLAVLHDTSSQPHCRHGPGGIVDQDLLELFVGLAEKALECQAMVAVRPAMAIGDGRGVHIVRVGSDGGDGWLSGSIGSNRHCKQPVSPKKRLTYISVRHMRP